MTELRKQYDEYVANSRVEQQSFQVGGGGPWGSKPVNNPQGGLVKTVGKRLTVGAIRMIY